MIKAVLFDVIGTTVQEHDPALINTCFVRAFSDHGIEVTETEIRSVRGMSKENAIRRIIGGANASSAKVNPVLMSFHNHVVNNISNFSERKEFPGVMEFLRERNIRVHRVDDFPFSADP